MKAFVFFGVGSLLASGSLLAATVLDRDHPNRIPDHYIVKLKHDAGRDGLSTGEYVLQQADRLQQTYGIRVLQQYTHVFPGFSIKAKDDQIEALAADAAIERIEVNKIVRINATQSPATWGIDRVDARSGIDQKYNYTSSGKGVHAYIIDTGTRSTHNEFKGRMGEGFSSIDDGRGSNDCHGHGTHVSGTVGGTTYGVAKDVTVHGVRVLGCDGSGDDAGVIAGIDWVAQNAIKPAVANMSLGGDPSDSLDEAVQSAVASGVVFVVAAGNESQNACNVSPARVPEAMTVGATTRTDSRALYSNFGRCLDIFAPGSSITSAWRTSNTAISTISGTSMASPHVAGVVALYLEQNPEATPEEIETLVKENATPNVVRSAGTNSPNLFIYSKPD
ncbi:S8 family peptidase [Oligoflexus tunisiensis]|uniref:S8 family peptidase n=1 Tax=Oligoflexus tunisiensis TaxID=708132 RepID=UPI000A9823E3|nr:S8 family peptidase [Oligoflexus tunisiensis]